MRHNHLHKAVCRQGRSRNGRAWRNFLSALGWLWRLAWLPLHVATLLTHGCVVTAVGAIRMACLVLLGCIGLLLIGSVCFGLGSVLLYPLWR